MQIFPNLANYKFVKKSYIPNSLKPHVHFEKSYQSHN